MKLTNFSCCKNIDIQMETKEALIIAKLLWTANRANTRSTPASYAIVYS